MKRKRLLSIAVSSILAVSSLSAVTFTANAEETTEAGAGTTEASTEAETEATTEAATEPSTEATTEAPTEQETIDPYEDWVFVEDYYEVVEWSGSGDLTLTMDVSELGLEFGSFYALYDYDLNEIDSSYYVLTMNGNDTLTITVKEELLMSLTDGYYFIVAYFEKVTLAPAFIVEIPEKAEASAVEQTTVKKTGSPKTGVKGVGLAAAMLSLSGAVAFITRKRK